MRFSASSYSVGESTGSTWLLRNSFRTAQLSVDIEDVGLREESEETPIAIFLLQLGHECFGKHGPGFSFFLRFRNQSVNGCQVLMKGGDVVRIADVSVSRNKRVIGKPCLDRVESVEP